MVDLQASTTRIGSGSPLGEAVITPHGVRNLAKYAGRLDFQISGEFGHNCESVAGQMDQGAGVQVN